MDAPLARPRGIESRALQFAGSDDAAPAALRLRSASNADLRAGLQKAMAEKHEELLRPLVRRIHDWRDEGTRIVLVSPNLQHGERLESLLRGYGLSPQLHRTPPGPAGSGLSGDGAGGGDLLAPAAPGAIEIA